MSGLGRIYKRGDIYWIDYSFRGKRYRESSGSTRKGDAKKLLQKRTAEMGSGRIVGPDQERLTLADLEQVILTDYELLRRKSTKRLKTSLGHLKRHLGHDTAALDITEERLKKYVLTRRREGASDSSIQKELAALKKAMRSCSSLQIVPKFPKLLVDNVREEFFTLAEVEAVTAELPEPLKNVVRFAFYTGWRKSEILGLKWSQVLLEEGVIRLKPGSAKNREGREFPLHNFPALHDLIERPVNLCTTTNAGAGTRTQKP